MDSYDILAILQLTFRWIHVFAAILWVGQTFLFHLIERRMQPTGEAGVAGRMWMIHGGGYYEIEKRHLAADMPRDLVWFKWEAATTWVSGMILIGLTYHAGGFLVEPGQNVGLAASAGFGVIGLGWVVYDLLVRSPLGQRPVVFAVVSVILLMVLHAGLLEIMSTRSAFIHVGAVIGTIMAANVWMRILPSQRKALAAVASGEEPDPLLMATGPIRSRHNSLMVVPLVLVMMSNHYPTVTYGHEYSTLILGVILLVGWVSARRILGPAG